jgi:hypothetical protein
LPRDGAEVAAGGEARTLLGDARDGAGEVIACEGGAIVLTMLLMAEAEADEGKSVSAGRGFRHRSSSVRSAARFDCSMYLMSRLRPTHRPDT